jgi:hypothetical protein
LAQGPIDTSSPDAVMASLAELHERWTFSQFAEFTRAVPVLAAPAHFESAVLSEDRRAGGLTEGLALLYISLLDLPLALESDPFASHVSPERLHEGLEQVLHGHTVRDVVHAGRNREQAFLPRLEELYLSRVRELAEELENAEAETNSSGQHEDRRDLYRLRRDLARTSDFADRIGRRLNELERAGPFEPGAVQCALEDGVDLSSDEAMMTDLEAFAETCPQQRLIQVLRGCGLRLGRAGRLRGAGRADGTGGCG